MFNQARTMAEMANKNSAIILIDELGVIGAKRGKNVSHLEYDQTLNELLTQMDGIESGEDVKI